MLLVVDSAAARPRSLSLQQAGQEVEELGLLGVEARDEVQEGLLDLDHAAAGRRHLAQLLVHRRRQVPDELAAIARLVRS